MNYNPTDNWVCKKWFQAAQISDHEKKKQKVSVTTTTPVQDDTDFRAAAETFTILDENMWLLAKVKSGIVDFVTLVLTNLTPLT